MTTLALIPPYTMTIQDQTIRLHIAYSLILDSQCPILSESLWPKPLSIMKYIRSVHKTAKKCFPLRNIYNNCKGFGETDLH